MASGLTELITQLLHLQKSMMSDQEVKSLIIGGEGRRCILRFLSEDGQEEIAVEIMPDSTLAMVADSSHGDALIVMSADTFLDFVSSTDMETTFITKLARNNIRFYGDYWVNDVFRFKYALSRIGSVFRVMMAGKAPIVRLPVSTLTKRSRK